MDSMLAWIPTMGLDFIVVSATTNYLFPIQLISSPNMLNTGALLYLLWSRSPSLSTAMGPCMSNTLTNLSIPW